jgi:hypothetical protein
MSPPSEPVQSEPLDESDEARQKLAATMIERSNTVVIDFAKHVVTLAFSAVAVVLALHDKWIGPNDTGAEKLIALALVTFVLSGLVSSLAVAGQRLNISLSDYFEIEAELARAARYRARLTTAAMALLAVGVLLTIVVVLTA